MEENKFLSYQDVKLSAGTLAVLFTVIFQVPITGLDTQQVLNKYFLNDYVEKCYTGQNKQYLKAFVPSNNKNNK